MSPKVFKLFLAVAFLIVTFSGGAFAWGDEGHHITVRIAANYLDTAARIEVIRLLKVDAGDKSLITRKTARMFLT